MSKFTPGPWGISGQLITSPPLAVANPKVEPYSKAIASAAWDFDGDRGATEYRTKWPEAEANLRLIAAAPDLLAALLEIHDLHTDDDGDRIIPPGFLDNARAAIAKATGA